MNIEKVFKEVEIEHGGDWFFEHCTAEIQEEAKDNIKKGIEIDEVMDLAGFKYVELYKKLVIKYMIENNIVLKEVKI